MPFPWYEQLCIIINQTYNLPYHQKGLKHYDPW